MSQSSSAVLIFFQTVPNGAAFPHFLSHSLSMRMKDLTPQQLSSVPCPVCGAPPGKRCLLHSGALRNELHIDRKLAAAEAIESERFRRIQSLAKRGASTRQSILKNAAADVR
jgi:hypothetical protein